MAQSLLPNARPLGASTYELAQTYPDWPMGTPKGRLLQEYLIGRKAGVLDIAGRPLLGESTWADLPLIVIDDDERGALARVCAAARSGDVTVFNDIVSADIPGTRSLHSVADLEAFATSGQGPEYRVVLTAPKALLAMREYLQLLAGRAVEFLVIGRDKHMSRSINTELAKFFDHVDVAPGLGKSRLLAASGPKPADRLPAATVFPQTAIRGSGVAGVPNLTVAAHGPCFGGTGVDAGSALLLATLAERRAELEGRGTIKRLLDLGCGNGWLLSAASMLLTPDEALGVDISGFAVESARATLEANQLSGVVTRSDSAGDVAEGSCDLVVLNPPFHDGTKLTSDPTKDMVAGAYRVLAHGGWLVCVYNSVLRHRMLVNKVFGRSEQWSRDRRFTVVAARKR